LEYSAVISEHSTTIATGYKLSFTATSTTSLEAGGVCSAVGDVGIDGDNLKDVVGDVVEHISLCWTHELDIQHVGCWIPEVPIGGGLGESGAVGGGREGLRGVSPQTPGDQTCCQGESSTGRVAELQHHWVASLKFVNGQIDGTGGSAPHPQQAVSVVRNEHRLKLCGVGRVGSILVQSTVRDPVCTADVPDCQVDDLR